MTWLNEVRIAGRVAGEVRKTERGPYRFQIKRGGGSKKDGSGNWPGEYFSVVCWPKNNVGEDVIRQLVPGVTVEVVGQLRQDQWTRGGVTHRGINIVADEITLSALAPLTPKYNREVEDNPF